MSRIRDYRYNRYFSGSTHKKTLHQNLSFTAIEQYKLIRANLDYTLPDDDKCPVIGITSSMRGEGKSTTAVNLAYVFAETDSRVLLIDADLRIPSIAKKLGLHSSPGLSDLLRGKGIQTSELQTYLRDNWYILPSGETPPNPSELLGSKRMELAIKSLKKHFDYIIIDLPPVNIVSDALSISPLISGMIVVVREEYTDKRELDFCFKELKIANANILGCIMNETDSGSYDKYRKCRYYEHYKYYEYEKDPKGDEE